MHTVDEQPETIHLYVVREAAPKPPLLPIVLSFVALSLVIALGVLSPTQQPVTRAVIRVPAVLLPPRTFIAHVPVVPTGVHTYSATTAHGILTITNGSVISQTLPAGFIFITRSGVSIVTDAVVFLPAGNANGYGYATVSAHATLAGTSGNIPAYAIDQVLGSSVYVRNLAAFTGGRDAYSVTFVTPHDTQRAVNTAHHLLAAEASGLHYPCLETIRGAVIVTWRCQFLTYHLPTYMHVTGVRIQGKNLLVAVWFVARPIHIWVK
jgi:Baseplate J-like protein